ncbi:unnamed protein product [Ectocarpus sp. 13 AM-2016]
MHHTACTAVVALGLLKTNTKALCVDWNFCRSAAIGGIITNCRHTRMSQVHVSTLPPSSALYPRLFQAFSLKTMAPPPLPFLLLREPSTSTTTRWPRTLTLTSALAHVQLPTLHMHIRYGRTEFDVRRCPSPSHSPSTRA